MIELLDIAPSFSFILQRDFVKASDRYKPEEFGNADLVMDGAKFSLKFERDRGQVFVDIGGPVVGWEKLEYALIFVDDGITEERLGSPPEVAKLANLTMSHWAKIEQLYTEGTDLSAFRDFCKMRSSALISGIFSKS